MKVAQGRNQNNSNKVRSNTKTINGGQDMRYISGYRRAETKIPRPSAFWLSKSFSLALSLYCVGLFRVSILYWYIVIIFSSAFNLDIYTCFARILFQQDDLTKLIVGGNSECRSACTLLIYQKSKFLLKSPHYLIQGFSSTQSVGFNYLSKTFLAC